MICPYCQTSNEPGWAFCRSCGSPLSEQASNPAVGAPMDAGTPTMPVADPPLAPAQSQSAGAPMPGQPAQPYVPPVAPPIQPYAPPAAQPAQPYTNSILTQATVAMSSDTPLATPTPATGQPRQGVFTPAVSIGLAVAGGVVLVLALVEHYLVRGIQLLPHLAIVLAVLGVALLAAGVYGLATGNRSRAS
jgi:hypothetical protein